MSDILILFEKGDKRYLSLKNRMRINMHMLYSTALEMIINIVSVFIVYWVQQMSKIKQRC